MKDEKYQELNSDIKKFITDKKSIVSKLRPEMYKKMKKQLKSKMNERISDLNDVVSFRDITEAKIRVKYNNINRKGREIIVKEDTSYIKLSDAFNLSIRFLNTDLKLLLSDKYFQEAKKYRVYSKKDTDGIIYENMKSIISMRKEIVNSYIQFLLSLYKKFPELIKGLREEG